MDRYEAKESYVIKRNNENRAKLDGVLTEDQINAIESLCSFRHRLHISAEKLYNVQLKTATQILLLTKFMKTQKNL